MFNETTIRLFLGLNHVKANLGWKDGTWQGWNNELMVASAVTFLDDLAELGVEWDDLGWDGHSDTTPKTTVAQNLVNEAYKDDQFHAGGALMSISPDQRGLTNPVTGHWNSDQQLFVGLTSPGGVKNYYGYVKGEGDKIMHYDKPLSVPVEMLPQVAAHVIEAAKNWNQPKKNPLRGMLGWDIEIGHYIPE